MHYRAFQITVVYGNARMSIVLYSVPIHMTKNAVLGIHFTVQMFWQLRGCCYSVYKGNISNISTQLQFSQKKKGVSKYILNFRYHTVRYTVILCTVTQQTFSICISFVPTP